MIFLFASIGLFITIVFVHQRKPTSLVRADRMIRWRRILAGFLVWWVLGCLFTGIDYLLRPSNYVLSFTQNWFFCLPLALILTPLQTSFEELFFRSYFLQGMALILRNRIALVIINGILFMIPHLANPELQRGGILALYYFIFGAALAALTIYDNGLELALGIHAANNLFSLFFNTKDSALPIPSIWQVQTPNPPLVDIIVTILAFAIVYYIFFGRFKTSEKPE
jgi:membrane protease YdiL (CAAX protease family)